MTKMKCEPAFGKFVIAFLPLLIMACTLTANSVKAIDRPAHDTQTQAAPAPTPAKACQVLTGIDAGALNLRACGGTACPVLKVLSEGEPLTILSLTGPWLYVQTEAGSRGWVNSEYLDCEV